MIWHPSYLETCDRVMRRLIHHSLFKGILILPLVLSGGLISAAIAAEQVIVSKRTIYPGEQILREDLKAVAIRKKIRVAYRVVRRMDQLEGLVANRTILPGRYIPANSVRAAHVVKAGEPIRVVLRSGALAISMVGIPLTNGSVGQVIRIRNASSGKVFSGLVLDDGSVVAGAT